MSEEIEKIGDEKDDWTRSETLLQKFFELQRKK